MRQISPGAKPAQPCGTGSRSLEELVQSSKQLENHKKGRRLGKKMVADPDAREIGEECGRDGMDSEWVCPRAENGSKGINHVRNIET